MMNFSSSMKGDLSVVRRRNVDVKTSAANVPWKLKL
jgi:hypothetical protein